MIGSSPTSFSSFLSFLQLQIHSSVFSLQIQRDDSSTDSQCQGFQAYFACLGIQCPTQYSKIFWNCHPIWNFWGNSRWQHNCYYRDYWIWCHSTQEESWLYQVWTILTNQRYGSISIILHVTDFRFRFYINWTRLLCTGLFPIVGLVFFNFNIFRGIRSIERNMTEFI